jgi:hypothetical protein
MLAGERYGRLVAIAEIAERSARREVLWRFRCDCGNECSAVSSRVISGRKKSCGCVHRDRMTSLGRSKATHRLAGTPEHIVWASMIQRCENPKHRFFDLYGGRGIRVCGRWRRSFADFLADMGLRPSPTHQIDRFPDNDGPYEPGNCRWATPSQQQRNKGTSRLVEYNGVEMPLIEACGKASLPYKIVHGRLRRGWTTERALSEPLSSR